MKALAEGPRAGTVVATPLTPVAAGAAAAGRILGVGGSWAGRWIRPPSESDVLSTTMMSPEPSVTGTVPLTMTTFVSSPQPVR